MTGDYEAKHYRRCGEDDCAKDRKQHEFKVDWPKAFTKNVCTLEELK